MIDKLILFPYWLTLKCRHAFYNIGLFKSHKASVPTICVGNITVGGTGKTPTVEMLVEHYSQENNVVVLSRGYGRTTKGYRVVTVDDTYRQVGDEPLQMKRKFPNITVVVCEKRAFAIHRIKEEFPDTELIIMDDGFQHRYVEPLINIVIIDANRPVERDHLLPYGQLRDTKHSLLRAHYFIVTKCPEDMKPIDMRVMHKVLVSKPSQDIFFSRMSPMQPCPIFAEVEDTVQHGAEVIAMSGIGDNDAFNRGLARRYNVVATIDLDDHHSYRVSDLHKMNRLLTKYPNAVIMTTEKDAVKLANSAAIPEDLRKKLFYERISMRFIGNSRMELFAKIDNDIKNRDNGAHIRGL